MAERVTIDESALLWAAALVEDVDPTELLPRVDVGVLAAVAARADAADGPIDAAARLLVGIVRRRPFPRGNAAIGWLTVAELLAAAGFRITVHRARVVELCDDIRRGAADHEAVVAQLRRWAVVDGLACPVCGRRVHRTADSATQVMPGVSRFELTARCAFEHGRHDRSGRPRTPPSGSARRRPAERHQPVIAQGACGSFLVAGHQASLVVSPFCDDPPIVQVVEVGDVGAGDLVGRWDRLVERSTTLGFVPTPDALPDEHGLVDLDRLWGALGATDGRGPGAVAVEDTETHAVGLVG